MERLFYVGLLFLAMQVAQAQTTAAPAGTQAAVSKDDDTMVLALTESPEAGWRRLAQVLVQRGYSIQHSDQNLLTLSTYPLYKAGIGTNRVAGTVVSGTLLVRLYWGASADMGGGAPVLARRKHDRWSELVAIGQAFGGPVSYSTTVPD